MKITTYLTMEAFTSLLNNTIKLSNNTAPNKDTIDKLKEYFIEKLNIKFI